MASSICSHGSSAEVKLYSILKGNLLALMKVLRGSIGRSHSVWILLAIECDLNLRLYFSFIILVKFICRTGSLGLGILKSGITRSLLEDWK